MHSRSSSSCGREHESGAVRCEIVERRAPPAPPGRPGLTHDGAQADPESRPDGPLRSSLAIERRLNVVHLHGAVGHHTAWAQAVRFLSRGSAIEEQVGASEGPWWLSVRRESTWVLVFAPGVPERGS